MLCNDKYSFTQTGKIENDIKAILLKYNKEFTYKHSIRVANEAKKIAEKFHVDKEKVAFVYISYLWERKDTFKVIHPWLEEAYWDLKGIVQ
ncbi:hypothetical protein BK721_08245 [Bacillus thuringiensis serovar nigeriensis]|uniref:hypothetical protein n=1 Tax=Bacillus thuringiensis TaxID=1428 RepID=UPI000A3C8924|nr:hypothetical protein [Bacillus thuringiensis]MRC97965.1 hypothetical protein [Bacillus thuringiensis]OTX21826.1 hypothetical protein BK721_08245 [Bacillus thuringiensis serovar nigeriensis]